LKKKGRIPTKKYSGESDTRKIVPETQLGHVRNESKKNNPTRGSTDVGLARIEWRGASLRDNFRRDKWEDGRAG